MAELRKSTIQILEATMNWKDTKCTPMTARWLVFWKSTVICRTAAMLTLVLVASMGAGWLSPTLAHSQTTVEWNRAWCKAFGNCSSFHQFYRWRANSFGIFRAINRDIQIAQPGSNSRFIFEPYPAFEVRGKRLEPVQLGFHSAINRPALPSITNDFWTGGPGNWSNAGMWTAGLPNAGDNALIVNSKVSPVTLDINATINNLSIGSHDSLSFNPGTTLAVDGGTISNAGKIVITGGNNANAVLSLGTNTTLKGGGTVTLAYNGSEAGAGYIQQGTSGVTLTNVDNMINGTGVIGNGGLTLVNESTGVIDANTPGASLTLNGSGGVTNRGLMEATGTSILAINTAVDNNAGNITANGGTVEIASATIAGGTLNSINGGSLETVGNSVLDGSTEGALTLSKGSTYNDGPGTTTAILGTITNNGDMVITGGNNSNAVLGLNGNTTLNGGGTVTLAYNGSEAGSGIIQQNASNLTLTNVNNTIAGTGIIGNGGLTVINQAKGVIDANVSGAGLTLNGGGGVANSGLLEATGGGILAINTTVNNAGGNITANAGIVELVNATIVGGTLNNMGKGTLETLGGASSVLDGSTSSGAITINGTYSGLTSSNTDVLGSINNKGTMVITGGNNTNAILGLNANTTLTGGGTVTLAYDGSEAGSGIIQQNAANLTLTNANNTIQGEGIIGNGGLTLVNESGGTINANSAGSPVTGTLTLNGGGGVTNQGLMEATGTSTLAINTGVDNNAGNITANGGTVEVVSATIAGGTLNSVNGGSLETVGNSVLDGSTEGALTLSKGSTYNDGPGATTAILGTITNNGDMVITGGNNSNAVLGLNGSTTLNGGGTVTLAYNGSEAGSGIIQQNASNLTLTNVNNAIEGTGIIGNGGLTLINQAKGVIDANVSGAGLTLNGGGGVANSGLLEATGGGILAINTTVNNAGGNITANAGTVELVNATVAGGTLNSVNGGALETVGNSVLDGSTDGALTLSKGSTYNDGPGTATAILGTITNNGNMVITGGNNSNAELGLNGNTTLNGGGTVTLAYNGSEAGSGIIQQNASNLTLTNEETIRGMGIIGNGGLALVNGTAGTLFANVAGQTLLINGSGNITNDGIMRVASGAIMRVMNGAFTNFSGTTLNGGTYSIAGTLEIDELGSTGGEIVTNEADIILNGANSSFIDAAGQNALSKLNTNAKSASFAIEGGRDFTTAGKFTNNGTLTVGSSNSKFKVTGNLTNFSTTTLTLTGGTYDLTGTLQFKNADIETNAANISLSGGSSAIVDQNGNNGLVNFATNDGRFAINNGRNFTTAGNFTNSGTLTVGSSNSTFDVNGSLTNFSGTTLTGGIYNLTGTLQFNGANIVTNAANITLTGTSSQIIDQHSNNGLANFATNNGRFALAGGRSFTTVGNFTNAGTFAVNTGSIFALGASGMFTQSAGTTTDNGSLSAPGAVNLQGGSLFGTGSITGNVLSSGTVTPGDSSTLTGILTDTGTYTQNSKGNLDISIGGTTAGSKFDELNSTNASLNGTLNIGLVSGYVPTIGNTFKIMNFTSETGTFSTVNGLNINSKEHFKITYQGTDVLLTVVSGALATGQPIHSHFFPGATHQPAIFGRFQMGMFSDLWFRGQSPDIPGGVSTLFHPGLALAKAGFMAAPNRFGFSTNFRVLSTAISSRTFIEALPGRANLGDPQFQVSAAPATLRSSIFRQALVTSPLHFQLTPNPVHFAALRSGNPEDSFGAPLAGARVGASASAPGMVFRSSQFQSISVSLGRVANSAGSGLLGVNPSVPPPTRWGSRNVPTTRTNSGGLQALHGSSAMRTFSVSLSNVMTKPKVGFAIQ